MSRHSLVFGLGITGLSCLRYLAASDQLTLVDTRPAPPLLAQARQQFPAVTMHCGVVDPALFTQVDRIIVSPGLPLEHPWLDAARAAGVPLASDIALFLDAVQAPVIGITGTNGKSTVTTLTAALLRASGFSVAVGGNLGEPALDLLSSPAEIYVLELSSFQLERLQDECLALGAVLNVSPDHMDRYPTLAAYAAAKQRIYQGARVAVHNRADALTAPPAAVPQCISVGLDQPPGPQEWGIADIAGHASLCRGGDAVLPLAELAMHGRHNEFNALAALALATAAGADPARCAEVLRSFPGLDHRCQLVGQHQGVRFINDSKATNVGATVAALEGLGDRHQAGIILIAGGDAKNADLQPLREPVRRWVREVVLLGKDAPALAAALDGVCPVHRVASLEAAVACAAALARRGDIVLLSPACASLDMFTNFEARGRAFAAAVAALEAA